MARTSPLDAYEIAKSYEYGSVPPDSKVLNVTAWPESSFVALSVGVEGVARAVFTITVLDEELNVTGMLALSTAITL